MNIQDVAAEEAVLSGLCQYGNKVFLDISSIVDESCFSKTLNAVFFKCIHNLLSSNELPSIDVQSIISSSQEINVHGIVTKKESLDALKAIVLTPVNKDGLNRFALKLRKIKLIKDIEKKFADGKSQLQTLNGTESTSEIIGVAENIVFDLATNVDAEDTKPSAFGEGLVEIIEERCKNPVTQLGLSSGFSVWDKSIGGLRAGVHIIGARSKVGKSTICANMGLNIAFKDVPVLYIDTEMTKKEQSDRLLASMTEIEIDRIATGKIVDNKFDKRNVLDAARKLGLLKNYQHRNVVGMSFENQLAMIRRWLINDVGLLPDGTAKNCLIIYDYLKLMDDSDLHGDLKEYQLLGFMTSSLHNICARYDIPVLAAIQLNRDGISKESTDVVSGSDRIIWLCTSFSILKTKSDEEIKTDGPNAGNRKLVPVVSRHGAGLDDKEYINCHFQGSYSRITEGRTNFEIANSPSGQDNDGFITDEDDQNTIM